MKIKDEQLKRIQDIQKELSETLNSIGYLENTRYSKRIKRDIKLYRLSRISKACFTSQDKIYKRRRSKNKSRVRGRVWVS
jgi:hypothetical protein